MLQFRPLLREATWTMVVELVQRGGELVPGGQFQPDPLVLAPWAGVRRSCGLHQTTRKEHFSTLRLLHGVERRLPVDDGDALLAAARAGRHVRTRRRARRRARAANRSVKLSRSTRSPTPPGWKSSACNWRHRLAPAKFMLFCIRTRWPSLVYLSVLPVPSTSISRASHSRTTSSASALPTASR